MLSPDLCEQDEAPRAKWLLGGDGGDFVATLLSTKTIEPSEAIRRVQTEGALARPECGPLLALLDDLGYSRSEIYQVMLFSALEILKKRIPHLSDEALVRLLEASFAYVRIEDLQEVPLEVLKNLREVPPAFLKQVGCAGTSKRTRLGAHAPRS